MFWRFIGVVCRVVYNLGKGFEFGVWRFLMVCEDLGLWAFQVGPKPIQKKQRLLIPRAFRGPGRAY